MKKVLIAVDYNPNSEKIAEQGYELAKSLDAQVCLLHVVSDVRYYGMQYPSFLGFDGYVMPVDNNVTENIQEVAKEFLTSAKQHLNDPTIETHIDTGDTAEAILRHAKKWGATMIIMGTHSHGTFEKMLMGTVASSLIEKTEVPVYLIPIKKKEHK